MTDIDKLSAYLQQCARTTIEAMEDMLGTEFEAVLLIYPSKASMDHNLAKGNVVEVPAGRHSTCEDDHTQFMLVSELEHLGATVIEEPAPVSPIWTPPGAGDLH